MKEKKIDVTGRKPYGVELLKWFVGPPGWSGLQVLERFGSLVSWTVCIDQYNQLGDQLKPASGMLGDQLHQFKSALCRVGELRPS